MKKIYTFTLGDEDIPSGNVKENIKMIAYLLYESLQRLEYYRNIKILVNNSKIKTNYLYDKVCTNGYECVFESERNQYDNRMFNPMMINDYTFGVTVYDETISTNDLKVCLNRVLGLMRLDYNFIINGESYNSRSVDDESMRFEVLKRINKKYNKKTKTLVKTRKLIPLCYITKLI